jgi:hypothetical protein
MIVFDMIAYRSGGYRVRKARAGLRLHEGVADSACTHAAEVVDSDGQPHLEELDLSVRSAHER